MAEVMEYDHIRQYLSPETHKNIRDQIGKNLGDAVRKFEKEIREKKKVSDAKEFAENLKKAALEALKTHLPIKDDTKMGALARSIVNGALREYFGVDEAGLQKMLDEGKIADYDDFHKQLIDHSKSTAGDKLYGEADQAINQYLLNKKHRPTLFDKSEKDLGDGFSWTENARKNEMDAKKLREVIKTGIEKALSPKHATDIYDKTIEYKPSR